MRSFLPPALLALAVLVSGCQARQSIVIRDDLGADVAFQVKVDDGVAAKLAKFRSSGAAAPDAPLFDAASVSRELSKRAGAGVPAVKQDGLNGVSGTVSFKDLRKAVADPASGPAGVKAVTVVQDGKTGKFSVFLDRTTAKDAFALFPGLDPALVEALAPPALEGQALTEAEYVEMLTSVLGSKYVPAVKAAEFVLDVTVPGTIVSRTGGTVAGRTVTWKIPVLTLLVLENPVKLGVSWTK